MKRLHLKNVFIPLLIAWCFAGCMEDKIKNIYQNQYDYTDLGNIHSISNLKAKPATI